jgi:putative mRNA 3-end processing factor
LLAGLDAAVGPILTHGAVERMTEIYRVAGVPLAPTTHAALSDRAEFRRALVLAPPSADGSVWARRFGAQSTGFASGWMAVRGARRRQAVDRGFAISDHVDWPSLLAAIAATGAERVWATHGFTGVLVRWLTEQGLDARALETRYEGERDDAAGETAEEAPAS